ncbi:MAG: polyprenyl diphosphate synthase [Lachnospirales bacterium]
MDKNNLKIPKHIGIIMDGNGRYAKSKFLPKKLGHKAGAEVLRKIVDYSMTLGVEIITAYAFSTENWKRSEEEVRDIMDLLREYLDKFKDDVRKKDVKVVVIGELSRLDDDLQEKIYNLMEETKDKKSLILNLAINYGGRDEIVRATNKIIKASKEFGFDEVTEDEFEKYLDTAHCIDPELLIRTSNEYRISNFLLWQLAYSEIYITEKLWPEFTKEDLDLGILEYNKRNRRFGG